MFSMFKSKSTLFALSYLVLLLDSAVALPSPVVDSGDIDLVLRQNPSTVSTAAIVSATTVNTTNIIQTPSGPATQTCVYTFTPDGQMVQELSNCTIVSSIPSATTAKSSAVTTPTPTAIPNNHGSSPSHSVSTPSPSVTPTALQVAFVMPGRSLLVLPVGLGIFCGIMGIAIIVVAFVTFERTRYRRAFRLRKLAESTALMGGSTKV